MSVSGEQEYTAEVEASLDHCFATITDFERYPEWFSAIRGAAVESRHRDGLGKRVEFTMSMPLKTVRYVLEYAYEKPGQLTWKSVDGDIESIAGEYTFESLGKNRTRATCRQAISVGFWIPGPIRRLLEQGALQQSVLEFKAAAENTATAASKPARKKKT